MTCNEIIIVLLAFYILGTICNPGETARRESFFSLRRVCDDECDLEGEKKN